MMNFDEFVQGMRDNIKRFLPEEYEDAKVLVAEQKKLNVSYTGLSVMLPDERITPCINMDYMYEAYMNGIDLRDIIGKTVYSICTDTPEIDVSSLKDYEFVKDRLFIKVCNAEKNTDLLATMPHELKEDLAITYHVLVVQDEDGVGSYAINNSHLEAYGITKEQLQEDAMRNAPKIMPVSINSLANVIDASMRSQMERFGLSEDAIQEMLNEMDGTTGMYVVRNECAGGASALFYPDVMEDVSKRLGADFFIIPSSVDEMIVVLDNGNMTTEELEEMIRDVNHTLVDEEIQLSNEAYHYDSDEKIFEKSSVYEERKAQKNVENEKASNKKSVLKNLDEKKKAVVDTVREAANPKKVAEAAI